MQIHVFALRTLPFYKCSPFLVVHQSNEKKQIDLILQYRYFSIGHPLLERKDLLLGGLVESKRILEKW